jgi:hypothetical protein
VYFTHSLKIEFIFYQLLTMASVHEIKIESIYELKPENNLKENHTSFLPKELVNYTLPLNNDVLQKFCDFFTTQGMGLIPTRDGLNYKIPAKRINNTKFDEYNKVNILLNKNIAFKLGHGYVCLDLDIANPKKKIVDNFNEATTMSENIYMDSNRVYYSGLKAMKEYGEENGFDIMNTLVEQTPSGGIHLYYKTKTLDTNFKNSVKSLRFQLRGKVIYTAIDVRSQGGIAVNFLTKNYGIVANNSIKPLPEAIEKLLIKSNVDDFDYLPGIQCNDISMLPEPIKNIKLETDSLGEKFKALRMQEDALKAMKNALIDQSNALRDKYNEAIKKMAEKEETENSKNS